MEPGWLPVLQGWTSVSAAGLRELGAAEIVELNLLPQSRRLSS